VSGKDHRFPTDPGLGTIPSEYPFDELEERLRSELRGKRAHTVSSPARVLSAWADFRAGPNQTTWGDLIYRLALLVTEDDIHRILGDDDVWPIATVVAIDSADGLWSGDMDL
jgi:hypothetical protein